MSKLADRALLVNVSISTWVGRKLDKSVTAKTNADHSAASSAGAYHKRLLPAAKSLAAIQAKVAEIRAYVYESTLPWLGDGTRILPSASYLDFGTNLRGLKSEFQQLVSDFVSEYPTLRNDARAQLGDMFKDSDYPQMNELDRKFSVDILYAPMPQVSDFRIQIDENDFNAKMSDLEQKAIADVFGRLHSVVSAAASKLGQHNAIFRDSLISNIEDIVKVAPQLNISNDAALASTIKELSDLVATMRPDTMRENASEREIAAKQLSDLEKRLRGSIL